MIGRQLQHVIAEKWPQNKVLVLLGARQTGKTTLIKSMLGDEANVLALTGDDPATLGLLEGVSLETLKSRIGSYKYVFIDEAQRIPGIGVTAKLIADQIPGIRLILTGSSSLELAEGTFESLTGRKREYQLHPISWKELSMSVGAVTAIAQLETRIIYGMYPEVITQEAQAQDILKELTSSYLYRDLLNYQGVRKPRLLEKILQALAWQIGQEVSISEIAQLVGADKATVESYIDLLEKAFIVFRLKPLSRNLRNEISKFNKVYFWDTGIRNMLISNLNPLNMRQDTGYLFENFIIAERLKKLSYDGSIAKTWFWRTRTQQEIDFIEEQNGKFHAYEIKWNPKAKARFPNSFENAYGSDFTVINKDNFDAWLM